VANSMLDSTHEFLKVFFHATSEGLNFFESLKWSGASKD
jgi:hypothetical protein